MFTLLRRQSSQSEVVCACGPSYLGALLGDQPG